MINYLILINIIKINALFKMYLKIKVKTNIISTQINYVVIYKQMIKNLILVKVIKTKITIKFTKNNILINSLLMNNFVMARMLIKAFI
jgi:hypothetical protein